MAKPGYKDRVSENTCTGQSLDYIIFKVSKVSKSLGFYFGSAENQKIVRTFCSLTKSQKSKRGTYSLKGINNSTFNS